MSWMGKLYQTYETGVRLDLPDSLKPLPINHTNQNAHIRVVLDQSGNFLRAEALLKTQIVLPATEKSAGRTSGEAPHPLADKLQYVAKDYADFGGEKKSYYQSYFMQLDKWANSTYSNLKLRAIRDYVAKGVLIADLIKHRIVHIDSSGKLLSSWPEDEGALPELFKTLPKEKGFLDQGNALVTWSVEVPGDQSSDMSKDLETQENWIEYEQSMEGQLNFCFVNGEVSTIAESHPAKLRHSGDKAKLISSNDNDGFTFRGRFLDASQPASVGVIATQKSHSALKWLIDRQGFRNGDQAIVTWAVSCMEIPQPLDDSFSFLESEVEGTAEPTDITAAAHKVDHSLDVGQYFSIALKNRLNGYQATLPTSDRIIVMGLDSATPGRMAITYYQELDPKDFLNRLAKWYLDFSWFQRRSIKSIDSKGREVGHTEWRPGTPAPKEIVEAIFGDTISDSQKKNTIERMLPCIVEGSPLPRDLSERAFRKTINRHAYSSDQQWLWEKNLGITCSLFKGFCKRSPNHTRDYSMDLEEDNFSRDYLFGRLLAIAERIEEIALSVAGEDRSTTAARLMQRFADRPSSTWRNIELALQPYIQRLKAKRPGFLYNQQALLDDIMGKFKPEDFSSDKPLTGEFLLAFHTQRLEMRSKPESNTESDTANQ